MSNNNRHKRQASSAGLMGLLLKLAPAQLEQEFWSSPACVKLYTRWDVLALLYAVFINFTLLRAFWHNILSPALWHWTLQFSLYLVTAVLQLLHLYFKPGSHQKHRLTIMAAHRLCRVFFMGLSATIASPAHSATVASTLSSTNSHAFVVPGVAWVKFLRTLLSHPLVGMAPSNFVLPVRYVVILQPLTLCFMLRMVAGQPCKIAQLPELQGLLLQTCSMLSDIMHTSSVLLLPVFGTHSSILTADKICSSNTTAAVVLVLYAHVVFVVLVPCYVIYRVERSVKRSFLQSKELSWDHMQSTAGLQAHTAAATIDARKVAFAQESDQAWLVMLGNCLVVSTGLTASWHLSAAAVAASSHSCM